MKYLRLAVNWFLLLTAPLWLGFFAWYMTVAEWRSYESPLKNGERFLWDQ